MRFSASLLKERLHILAHDPSRALRGIRVRLYRVPYQLGIRSPWPGSFLAYIPDRYSIGSGAATSHSRTCPTRQVAAFVHRNRANNAGDMTRFYLFNLMFEQIAKEEIPGDIAELGVYKGNTAVLLADFARATGRKAYLFDTFHGFSPSDIRDIDADKRREFTDTSLGGVRSLVGSENVEYVVGHFPDSITSLTHELRLCMAHLDCDLYLPMKAGVEYFYDRLVPGGFLVVHDYSSLNWDGAERALDEFLANKPERLVPIPDKSGTAVIRKTLGLTQ